MDKEVTKKMEFKDLIVCMGVVLFVAGMSYYILDGFFKAFG